MTITEMMDKVVFARGLEDNFTIYFFRIVEENEYSNAELEQIANAIINYKDIDL